MRHYNVDYKFLVCFNEMFYRNFLSLNGISLDQKEIVEIVNSILLLVQTTCLCFKSRIFPIDANFVVVATFSSQRDTPCSHVLNFDTTPGHSVLCIQKKNKAKKSHVSGFCPERATSVAYKVSIDI